jgi:hypothetical protein
MTKLLSVLAILAISALSFAAPESTDAKPAEEKAAN